MVRVEFKESSGPKREMRIEVPASEVDEKLKVELANLQRSLKMPGFRKGKVPSDLVRRKFIRSVRREVAERLVRDTYLDAVREHDLRPVGPPEIRDVQFEDGQPLSYHATVEIWPEVSIRRVRGLKLTREVVRVEEEDIGSRLHVLREMHRELLPVDRGAQKGDVLLVDYDVFDEEDRPLEGGGVRNQMVELGTEGLLREFDEGLEGAKPGESRTIRIAFPEEGAHREVTGKTVRFWVKVKAVKEKRLPELDDDFAKELGNFDRLEDVKNEIREGLRRQAELDAERRVREALVDQLIQENPFEVPESMVATLLEAILSDAEKQWQGPDSFDREKARSALRPVAVRQSKRFILLRELARQESLKVTPGDVDGRIRVLALRTQQSPEEMRRRLESEGSMDELVGDLLEEKSLDLLVEGADVENVERRDPDAGGTEKAN